MARPAGSSNKRHPDMPEDLSDRIAVQALWSTVNGGSRINVLGKVGHWSVFANCAGMIPKEHADPDPFFPKRGESTLAARRICRQCPVEEECLLWAILTKQQMGILGGMTKEERQEVGTTAGIWLKSKMSEYDDTKPRTAIAIEEIGAALR